MLYLAFARQCPNHRRQPRKLLTCEVILNVSTPRYTTVTKLFLTLVATLWFASRRSSTAMLHAV